MYMKSIIRLLIVFSFAVIFFNSCEKDNSSKSSIVGTWRCVEVGTISVPNPYFVNIIRSSYDTTIFIIENFYNIGLDKEIQIQQDGMNLVILSTTNYFGYHFTGTAKVESDYKLIEWDYEVDDGSGVIDFVTGTYTRD